jgi:YfiH family protein
VLGARLDLPAEPAWLEQVHGVGVATPAELAAAVAPVRADAAYAGPGGPVCAILTADCLPVLLCDRRGRWVAAAHAGWRGLAAGVIEATVAALRAAGVAPHELLAWLGPGIRAPAYEVGDEVRSAFLAADPAAASGFAANARGRWQLDLPALARQRLAAAGVGQVHGGTRCTHAEPARFFSHRRDGQTGRQATLIWLERG